MHHITRFHTGATWATAAAGLCALASLALFSSVTHAEVNDGLIDGNYGVLRVYGTLTEGACRLEMASADQSVNLGNVSTGNLKEPGDRGALIPVELRLHDCLRSSSSNRDAQDNLTWTAGQPAVSFTFTGVQDPANPQLIAAQGVSGMGLRLKDSERQNVILGQKGKPLLLTPSSNVVTYYIAPERTRAALQAGTYNANINFRLSYE
ncbi:fimbrial protein [Enterobacter hormaechei]|uniref:fimbrial protein n=1 Tax=Enterobacter hormaechei TaxID=158836 RepID=UPI00254C0A9D|nr:fimbrial protein [Enterobacter hormaechei]MDK9637844.1 fimbrial protein [Enterobacter hormaechei]